MRKQCFRVGEFLAPLEPSRNPGQCYWLPSSVNGEETLDFPVRCKTASHKEELLMQTTKAIPVYTPYEPVFFMPVLTLTLIILQ